MSRRTTAGAAAGLTVLAILSVGGVAASKILPGDEPKRAAVGAAIDGSDQHLYRLAKQVNARAADGSDRHLYQLAKQLRTTSQQSLTVQQIEQARWAAYVKQAEQLYAAAEGSDRHLCELAKQVRTTSRPALTVQQIDEARWAEYVQSAQEAWS